MECRKLRQRFSHQSSSADSPCSFVYSSPVHSSPASSQWSLQEIEEHLNKDDFADYENTPAPLELHQALQSLSDSCNDDNCLQSLFSVEPACESILGDSKSSFCLDVLDKKSPLDTDPVLNLIQADHTLQPLNAMCGSQLSTRSLSRQSSSNSSCTSVQLQQGVNGQEDLPDQVAVGHNPVKVESVDVCAISCTPSLNEEKSLPALSYVRHPLGPTAITSSSPSSPVPSIANSAISASGLIVSGPSNVRLTSTCPSVPTTSIITKQVHLPEPPEADPQVMLNSLPEKGKLLHAVLQAGPLLQTLLLAGPLPQWRCPPPAVSALDIPKVNVFSSGSPMVGYPCSSIGYARYFGSPMDNGASSLKRRVDAVDSETGGRPHKLRKLSPAFPCHTQFLQMPVRGRP
ncbi:hypothetical protein KP509_04G107400 [Ceratopteris richardii]|nr:hypothetical protein KP509_04G107400 [Ceratopteris richardii]